MSGILLQFHFLQSSALKEGQLIFNLNVAKQDSWCYAGYNNGFFVLQKEVEKVNDVAVKIEEKTATLQVSA
jgi:hypothetical protein